MDLPLYSVDTLQFYGLIITVLIVFNQLLKYLGMVSKYAIVSNLVIGALLNLYFGWGMFDPVLLILQGFLMGATAGGIYDVKKLLASGDDTSSDGGNPFSQ